MQARTINWRRANWLTAGFFVILLGVSRIPKLDQYFGFLSYELFSAIVTAALAKTFNNLLDFYAKSITSFEPLNVLEARQANEQIKSLSTLINAVAAGSVIALTVREMTSSNPDFSLIVLFTGMGVWIHTAARNLLGMLKDENFSVPSAV